MCIICIDELHTRGWYIAWYHIVSNWSNGVSRVATTAAFLQLHEAKKTAIRKGDNKNVGGQLSSDDIK